MKFISLFAILTVFAVQVFVTLPAEESSSVQLILTDMSSPNEAVRKAALRQLTGDKLPSPIALQVHKIAANFADPCQKDALTLLMWQLPFSADTNELLAKLIVENKDKSRSSAAERLEQYGSGALGALERIKKNGEIVPLGGRLPLLRLVRRLGTRAGPIGIWLIRQSLNDDSEYVTLFAIQINSESGFMPTKEVVEELLKNNSPAVRLAARILDSNQLPENVTKTLEKFLSIKSSSSEASQAIRDLTLSPEMKALLATGLPVEAQKMYGALLNELARTQNDDLASLAIRILSTRGVDWQQFITRSTDFLSGYHVVMEYSPRKLDKEIISTLLLPKSGPEKWQIAYQYLMAVDPMDAEDCIAILLSALASESHPDLGQILLSVATRILMAGDNAKLVASIAALSIKPIGHLNEARIQFFTEAVNRGHSELIQKIISESEGNSHKDRHIYLAALCNLNRWTPEIKGHLLKNLVQDDKLDSITILEAIASRPGSLTWDQTSSWITSVGLNHKDVGVRISCYRVIKSLSVKQPEIRDALFNAVEKYGADEYYGGQEEALRALFNCALLQQGQVEFIVKIMTENKYSRMRMLAAGLLITNGTETDRARAMINQLLALNQLRGQDKALAEDLLRRSPK